MRRPRLRTLLKVGAVVVALGVAYVGFNFVQVWTASNRDEAREVEAIIVLGAAQYDGDPSPVLRERLDHALELFEAGMAQTIVVTGGRQSGDRFTEATASYNYLRGNDVPDEAILKEVQGTNTWEQIAASARFLRARGVSRVLLVTDDYHAYRAKQTAEELGLEAYVSPIGSGRSSLGQVRSLARETMAVSVARFVGYRRLANIDDVVAS